MARAKKQSISQKPTHTKQRVKKAVQEHIAKAVETIPNLIMQEMQAKALDGVQTNLKPYDSNKNKRILLWSGVTAFTAIILSMWIWNAWSVMYDVRKTDGQEARLIDDAKNDLSQILNTLTSQAEKSQVKSVKEALRESLAPLLIMASTTSTTDTSSPSTSDFDY